MKGTKYYATFTDAVVMIIHEIFTFVCMPLVKVSFEWIKLKFMFVHANLHLFASKTLKIRLKFELMNIKLTETWNQIRIHPNYSNIFKYY